ncbi:MAG: choice-of-anchor J domain-containing protein [Candidatus Cloacimonetes bacterium]|nr:choice-of-anchor J domain-containing protein [Candidatus Cloacimonadota bacterium]
MLDSYGDSWNGGMLTVNVNGTAVLTDISPASGDPAEYEDFDVINGDEITTVFTDGSWSYENYYAILDHLGNIVAESGGTWDNPGSTAPVSITTPIIVTYDANAPVPASEPSPANNATNVLSSGTLTWSFGANTATYELWLGLPGNMVMVDSGMAGATGSYSYSGLAEATVYNWQVISENSGGSSTDGPVWAFITAMPAISSFDPAYTQDFDGTWAGSPAAPIGWTVINADEDTYMWSQASTYITARSAPHTAHGMGNADDYLITPQIDLIGVDVRMKWWDIVESASYANSYKVLLSTTDPEIASFTVELADITCANTEWTEHTLNLDAYNGQTVYIAFYQYASAATYYGFGIDDFLLEEIPESPIFVYTPDSIDFGVTLANTPTAYTDVVITNTGGGTLALDAADITLIGDFDQFEYTTTGFPAALTVGQSVNIPVRYVPDTTGSHTATLRMNYGGTYYDVALTGAALNENAYMEGFESGAIPDRWTVINADGGAKQWEASTSNPHTGSYSARIGYETSSLNNDDWLITPPLQVSSATTDVISFWMRSYNASYADPWQVLISTTDTNPASFTMIDSGTGQMGEYVQKTYPLDSYGDAVVYLAVRYMGAYDWYLYVDDFTGPPLYVPTGPPDPVTLIAPENGATDMPIEGFDLTWAPSDLGGTPDYYILYMASSEENIYDEQIFDNIQGTSFNPVTGGSTAMSFNYSERWFWTVQAVNTDGPSPEIANPYFFDIIGSPAQIAVSPLSFTETLEVGQTSTQMLTMENAGGRPLNFRFSFEDTTPRATRNPVIGNIVSSPSAALNAEKSTLATRNSIDASRAQLDLQFAYPTAINTGEYGVASDGEFIYTSRWSSTAGALEIYKYDLEGNYLEEIIISGANGVRDLAYDGTYFYGASAATPIYQMDFNTATLIGTITAPVPVRAITYDPDNDAFWVSNNWADPLQLVNRNGAVLRTLDTAATDFAGIAYDNLSGEPSIWVNSQTGDFSNTLVQVNIADGSIIQSFPLDDTIVPGITVSGSAGGVEIVSGIVPGFATILGMHQNEAIYGLELCTVTSWVNADPRSGSVDIAGNMTVNINFDANNIAPGEHTGIFTIDHNADTASVQIPVSLTVTGEWLPVFGIDPVQWDFADVELMNPAAKEFTIHNSGGPGLTITSGDIYISDDVEGNFSVMANNLPADLGYNDNYNFDVLFTPQSLGAKTATLNVEDNLGRVLHSYPLSGNGIDEPIGQVVNLSAEVQDLSNVMLNWGVASTEPGEPGWLHYDNGTNADGIGTGGIATFNVAIKYTGADLWNYDGMQIEKIKFFPRSANTNYSLRIWTGNDVSLAPATLMYSQDVTLPTIGAWNEIVLDTPFPIVQGQALWFGYYCDVLDGEVFHPAGCDAGPAVVGKGDLIELGGTWYSMYNQYNINANWNLQAYVNDPSILSKATPQWLNIPVTNLEPSREALSNLRLSTSGNPTPSQRALRGFNIYRDGNPINAEIVAAYSYLDEGLAAGTYNYAVQPVYFSANGAISNPVSVTVDPPPLPHALPFTEDWASADFETNLWTSGSANWVISSANGAPAPSVSFSWTPQVTDYSIPLTSYEFDATGIDNVQFSFDIALNNYSTDAENVMIWEIWDGSSWNTLGGYSSLNDDLAWTRFAYDISAYASNRVFKIRFVASGEDSYEINFWYIDNIHLAELPTTVAPITDLALTSDGTNLILSWTAIPNANWYYIYASEDPYGIFAPLGWIDTAGTILPIATLEALGLTNKAFVKVTAGAGPFPPRGERLGNVPAAKRK